MRISTVLIVLVLTLTLRADDGYRLWLRHDRITDAAVQQVLATQVGELVLPEGPSPLVESARAELIAGLRSMLGANRPPTLTITAAWRWR